MENKNISDYINQIKDRNCGISQKMLDQCKKDISTLEGKIKNRIKENTTQKECINEINKWLTEAQKKKLKQMKDYSQTQTDQNLMEIIYILILGVYATFGKKIPRTTQLICFWLNIHSQKTILEVKTGEGKTMIVAMTALYYALRGKKVDVFTSSQALATTQTQKQSSVRKYYELFGVTLDENCSIKLTLQQASKVYQSQIIYGTSFNFQADYLRKVFTGQVSFFKDREFDQNHVAILDEVDALLIDRMKDSTRLSSQKPLYETIKMLFVLIYEVKTKLMRAKQSYGGVLTINILGKQIKDLNIQNKIVDDKSEKEIIDNQIQQIGKIISYALQNDLKNFFPPYLLQKSSYITHMLKTWIKNSFQSNQYEQDVHYIVTRDRKIIPIDVSTGTYQKNTKWSNGIHQFVELRHGIQPSVDSLVTNYESNLIFFQRYKKYLYGMTGTIARSLGNQKSHQKSVFQQSLQQIYEVKIFKIPTFRKRLLQTEYPRLMSSKDDWMQVLIKQAKKYSQKRMVLLIFKTIKQAKEFIFKFKQQKSNNKGYSIVELYDHDEYHNVMQKQMDNQKTIIVSTNLGGRGTDYEIKNKNILKNGGLFVMMTYFAQNWRIEEQAFGRAGRNGQQGSGAFYINVENYVNKQIQIDYNDEQDCYRLFQKLEQARQKIQLDRFQKARRTKNIQQQKKQILDKFIEKYISPRLQKLQQQRKIIQSNKNSTSYISKNLIDYYKIQMQLGLVEQQWGLFIKKEIGQNSQTSLRIRFQDFIQYYEKNEKQDNVNPGIITAAASKILGVQQHTKSLNSSCESYKLFQRAHRLNKEWISKYYLTYFKLKKYQNETVTKSLCNQLMEDLNLISNQMLVDLSIHLAMKSHFESSQQQSYQIQSKQKEKAQQEIKKTQQFFISQITNLQTIVKTLKQYVIEKQSTNIIYKCSLKTPTHSVPRLKVLGLDYVFTVTIQQKASFWKKFFIVLGAAVLTAIVGFLAPYLITSVPLILAVTGLTGVASLVGGFYLFGGNNQVKVKNQAQKKTLIQISGNQQNKLDEQAQKKMKVIYQKINQKKKQLNLDLKRKLQLLDEIKTMKKSQKKIQTLKKLKVEAFGSKKNQNVFEMQKTKVNQILEEQKDLIQEKIKICIGKKIKENKYDEKLNQIETGLNQKIKKDTQNLQNVVSNSLQTIAKKHQQKVAQQAVKLQSIKPKTQQQLKDLNKKIDSFNSKIQSDSKNLVETQQKIVTQVKKSITQVKPIDVKNLYTNIKLQINPQQSVKENLANIVSSVSQLNEDQNKKKYLVDFCNNELLSSKILQTDNQHNKIPQLKIITQDLQKQVISKIQNHLVEENKQAQEQLQKQLESKQSEVIHDTVQKVNRNIQIFKKTPIHQPSHINYFQHYSKVVINQCLHHKINVQTQAEGYEGFKQYFLKLKSEENRQTVFLMDGAVFFKGQQKSICKVYKPDLAAELEKIIGKQCKIIHQQKQTKNIGWSIVTDVQKFIQCIIQSEQNEVNDFGIETKSQSFEKSKVINKFMQSIIIDETAKSIQKQNPKILQQRKLKGNGSLPLTYFPFQIGLNSEFQRITNQIMNNVSQKYLIADSDFQKYHHYIAAAKDLLLKEQKQSITEIYKDYLKFLPTSKIRKAR